MRVSTSLIHMQGVQNILNQQAKLVRAQDELSRGEKILKPSDDPSGASRIIDLNEAISQIEQFDENANYATQRLNIEETTLTSVNNLLQRVRELAIQAGNTGTYDLESEQAIASEMREKLEELIDYANTKDENGDYIFSGFQSRVLPFTTDGVGNYFYNGDEGQLAIQIGANRQVMANDSGAEVFQLIRSGNGDFTVDANSTNGGTGRISTGSVVTPSLYQAHDFSIVMEQVFPINADTTGNVGTATVTASTITNNLHPDLGRAVQLFFDPANPPGTFDVIDYDTGTVLQNDVAYVAGMTVSQNGWQVTLNGVPQPGDDINISVLTDPPQFEYDVIDETTGATVLANQAYVDGGVIAFNGLEVEITGQPVDGDVFTVEASRHQDVFTTLSNLINSLETPNTNEVRGVFGGDYINNGFGAGETITFDLNFDGQVINFSVTPPTPTNDEVATQMMATIAGQAGIIANLDGTYTLPGTTAGASVTFRRVGDNIEFITQGGTDSNANSVVINNIADAATGDAVLTIGASGNSVTTQTTLDAAVAGDSASYLIGSPPRSFLNQQIDNALNNIDQVMSNIINVQTSIGGRLNSIESQGADNEDKKLYLQGVRSELKDLDFAEAISNMTFQTTALQIAQQTFARIQNLNLFNFL